MNRTATKHHIDGLLALLLFGVFAVCVLGVLLTGAQVYSRLTARDLDAYNQRTGLQYVATKMRQAPSGAQVRVERFGETDALVIAEQLDGQTYLTRVYFCDGWLRELFAAEGADMQPEDGEKLLAAEGLSLSLTDGLLHVGLTDSAGQTASMTLSLRGGEGGQP